LSLRKQDQTPGKNNADDFHRFVKGQSGLVIYPYYHRDYPPGHSKKEFACCIGPGQNLYIYTVDILNITRKDMIACGNIPSGKTKGYLANAIQQRGGNVYKSEMTEMFVPRPKEGDVVVCKSDLPNFKWVAHTILHQKIHCSKDDREFKVTSSLRNIFLAMKSYNCHSIALPLVGTGMYAIFVPPPFRRKKRDIEMGYVRHTFVSGP
jgi:O-acetyl-ADP-ribose deacetylase (regulator of RNase III)